MDHLLRQSLAAPIPSLPPDFDQQVIRKLRHRSQPFDRYRKILLTAYGLLSVATSAAVMRGHGLEWGPIIALLTAALTPSLLMFDRTRRSRS